MEDSSKYDFSKCDLKGATLYIESTVNQVGKVICIPFQIPPRPKFFTGRESEKKKIITNLKPGKIVTLCGPGGIGKSALAAEVIWELTNGEKAPEKFPDGVIWHNFYREPNSDKALEHIALSFDEEPRTTPQGAAKRALSGRKVLLLLDGTEDTDNLEAILEITGNCGVIITSRKTDDAPSDWQDIAPLEPEQAVILLQSWGGYFAKDKNISYEICELVGRLPLAIRIVGRYLSHRKQTAEQYSKWLKASPLQALDYGERQHESIPLLLERSIKQLSKDAKQALSVIGLLALTPFSEQVIIKSLNLSDIDISNFLGEMVSFGFLTSSENCFEVSHALIHTYARTNLECSKPKIKKIASYYEELCVEEIEEPKKGYNNLDFERDHIVCILEALFKKSEWRSVCKLALAVDEYLYRKGHWIVRCSILERGLKSAENLKDKNDECNFLHKLGDVYKFLAKYNRALKYHEKSLLISREIGDKKLEHSNLRGIGAIYVFLSQYEKAIEYIEQAITIARKIGNRKDLSVCLANLGIVYSESGKYNKAIEIYKHALTISREVGDRLYEGHLLNALGLAHYYLGEYEEAIKYLKEALKISIEFGERKEEGLCLGNLGLAYMYSGADEEAIRHLKHAVIIAQEINDLRHESVWSGAIGSFNEKKHQNKEAMDWYGKSIKIAQEIGDKKCVDYYSKKLSSLNHKANY